MKPASGHPQAKSPRGLVVLGATGSIGDTTFKVLEGLGGAYRVVGLGGGRRLEALEQLARRWQPAVLGVGDEDDIPRLAASLPQTRLVGGSAGLDELARMPDADIVVNGLVGAVGLGPTLAALDAGKTVAMANKEPLVMAGDLILERARAGGGKILPLDSEPNALWQCLQGEDRAAVSRLILTASGGAFRDLDSGQLARVTPEQALQHPTWQMGPKITVDSATLMNKGFEVLEAACLFGVGLDAIEVILHRQSVVHSMVEFVDGSILAHLGKTDMALPIQYALTYPQRARAPVERLDLASLGRLDFAAPDAARYPALALCYGAGRMGGTAPAALNAANEEAVGAFLAGRIGFVDIVALNEAVLDRWQSTPIDGIEAVWQADRWARQQAQAWIKDRRRVTNSA